MESRQDFSNQEKSWNPILFNFLWKLENLFKVLIIFEIVFEEKDE